MKTTRLLKPILLSLLLATGAAWAQKPAVEAVAEKLKQLYPKTTFRSVSETQLPGIYEVAMGKNVAYVEESGRYFLFGHLFDMETQKDLTAEKFPDQGQGQGQEEGMPKIDVSKLPLADAIKNVKGKGERVMYVFSDPDCPYCKQLENNLVSVDNVTVYTFMFPIDSLHPQAKAKTIGVWCAKNRVKAWDELMRKNTVPAGTCENPIERNIALAQSLSIQGTPTIILAHGTLIPGAVQGARLNELLNQAKK